MAKLFDRVKVNIPTTGDGDVEFGAASAPVFLTPAEAGALDGNKVSYFIVDGLNFEEGVGTIKDSVSTMEREVKLSKIGGVVSASAKINLSGTAVLALGASARDILTPDDNLASLKDAGTALTNLGGSAVGKSVFTSASAGAAQSAIGGTTVGKSLFTAISAAAAASEIVEYGSNANGNYLRFKNGYQICTGAVLASDAGFKSITFPAPFADTNYALVAGASTSLSTTMMTTKTPNQTTSGFQIGVIISTGTNYANAGVGYFCGGSWS